MSDKTAIEWADATWNPITGCSVISPGCTNCYAMRLAGGRLRHHPTRQGLTSASAAGAVWNGQTRLNESVIDQPLKWKRPRRIFVCAHGDLFHENVPDDWIDRIFAVMALCPHHVFMVLTKRPRRMAEYISAERFDEICSWAGTFQHWDKMTYDAWPAPNIWLGVSVEDQRRADERIPILLSTPAAKRFLSVEPLLGPIDLNRGGWNLLRPLYPPPRHGPRPEKIDWVIVGGESGPNARPMNPYWVRFLRDQCQRAGIAFFMKQMARKKPIPTDLFIREWP